MHGTTRKACWGSVLLAVAQLLVLDGTASAARRRMSTGRKRVVVTPFVGPGAARAYRGAVKGVRRRARLVPTRAYMRAARRLGVEGTDPDGMVRVCAQLRCHAVVTGEVQRKGRRYELLMVVHDASSGSVIGQRQTRVRSARRLTAAGAQLGRASIPFIQRGKVPSKDSKAIATAPPGQELDVSPEQERDRPPSRAPAVDATDAAVSTGEAGEPLSPELDAVASRRKQEADGGRESTKGYAFETLSLRAGLGFSTRRYKLSTANDTSIYDGGAYPEFLLEGAVYPLTRITRSFIRHLGVGVSYCRHISISTEAEAVPGSQASTDVDTSSQEFLIDARARWRMGDGAWSPILYGAVGWGFRDFDLATNDVLTSFNYQFVRIAADLSVPLGTPYIALDMGGDVRPLTGVGQEPVNAYGERTGGLAWSLRVGASGKLPFGLFYFARFEYLHFGMDFAGRSDLAPDQVRAIDRVIPASGSDRFLRFGAGVGYAF